MTTRRTAGRETWHRLLEWDRGQADSERLASRLLAIEGYEAIDPSHPLGGKDGGKDIVCKLDGEDCLVCIYFPRGQKSFADTLEKCRSDAEKTREAAYKGIVFFTNQEFTLSERETIKELGGERWVEVYHLERISAALYSPSGYGLRLEFLQIKMTREEQVSFFNDRDQILMEIRNAVVKPNAPKKSAIKSVQVQNPDLFGALSALTGSTLVECKKCKEVFRATNPLFTLTRSNEFAIVTCPSCGAMQRFK